MNKLKTFAITMVAAGATAITTTAFAAATDHTLTNVSQSIQVTLTAYTNTASAKGYKAVTIGTKQIISALENDAANIPGGASFDFGKTPQLVYSTTFGTITNTTVATNVLVSNTVALGVTNVGFITFTATNANGTNTITFTNTPASLTISNNAVGTTNGGTNIISDTNNLTEAPTNFVATNTFTFIGTNGLTNTSTNFSTNAGVWTVISAATNSLGITNVTLVSYSTSNSLVTNTESTQVGIEVQGGTAEAPVYLPVGDVVTQTHIQKSVTLPGTTSTNYDSYDSFGINVFNTNATGYSNNIVLSLTGFSKAIEKLDQLSKSKAAGTNSVTDTTFTATVSGSGYLGGTYTTNTNLVAGVAIAIPTTNEISGSNAVTSGTISNVIPVVVEGTIIAGAPKNLAQ